MRRGKLQRLRSKWGHVRLGVSHRVATTISTIRDRSYAYAGFPTRPLGLQDESDPAEARYMQLRQTLVRALLVEEVTYEPSSLLKKSRKAVVLITGADLVLVKMTSMTKAGSAVGRHSSTLADTATAGSARNGPGSTGFAGVSRSSSRAEPGLDAAAAVVADAHASVLAQHELNKMVKCEVTGDRLDLEFIVTGGAQFKVSAAALGLSAANTSTMPSSGTNSSSMSRLPSKHDEEIEELDAAAAADVLPAPDTSAAAETGLGNRSGSGGGGSQQQQAVASGKQTALASPRLSGSSPAMLSGSLPDAEPLGAERQAAAAADAVPVTSGCQAAQTMSPAAAGMVGSSGLGSSADGEDAPASGSGAAALLDDSAYRGGSSRSFDGYASSAPVPTTLGSRRLARIISRYGSNSGSGNSSTFAVGSPPGAGNGVSLSAAAGTTGKSFVKGLGSRALSSGDDGSRSSIRPVKTDDGEYLVWVESFSLTFSNPSLAEMAAELLRTGRSTMRQALDWLKQGLPFSPEFAVTHITQLNSRVGDEVLRAGPTAWGTVLQLPDSWAEAVSSAQLPDEQPLSTLLEVRDGPAAFKVHLATPAGLAEATLLPELVAVLSQQPCTHGQVLAVPVDLTLAAAGGADAHHEQQRAGKPTSLSRGQPSAGQTAAFGAGAGNDSGSSNRQRQAVSPGKSAGPAAAGRGMPDAPEKGKLGSQKGLTWADQQQQQGEGEEVADAPPLRRSTCSGDGSASERPAAAQRAASCSGAYAGKGGLSMHHSRSTPDFAHFEHLLPDTASVEFDSCDEADLSAEQDVQHAQQILLRPCADSSRSLPELHSRQKGVSTDGWKGDVLGDNASTLAAEVGGADSSTDEQRPAVSLLSGIQRQQSGAQLSFAAEVHAVLHVRLLLDTEDGSSLLAAACTLDAGNPGPQVSPFAVVGAAVGLEDAASLPLAGGALEMQHTLPQQPSILQLGPAQPAGRTSEHQQLMQTAAALLAALLCGLALLSRSTGAADVLVLCAALFNIVCMAAALQPAWFAGVSGLLQRLQHAHGRQAHAHGHHHHHHHHHHSSHHALKRQHSKGPTAAAGQGQHSAGLSAQRKLQGLRLQLLGGSFVKEALGLLEQQINAYRDMLESPDSCSVSYVSGSEIDDSESFSGEDEDHEMFDAVFVSSPEPAWITRDWRRRLWNARPTMDERSKLAGFIHAWRESVQADTILQQLPANFDWFQKHLVLRPLLKTQQGHMVVLLKMATLSNMPRVLAASNLTPTDLMLHCGFIWCWMFEEYARGDWPKGRFVLLADMSGLKLGQAVGEGQVGGRALGEVCNAFPERLLRCLVLGAPNWFNMLYRLIRPQLSPSTRAKVQVCTTPAEAVAELACCLGQEWVPAEYGGPCTRPYEEFPAQKTLLQHVAKLRQHSAP